MKKSTALITGITGQDGSLLADFLLEKDYRVVGVMRRNSRMDLGNAKHLENTIEIVEGDITDMSSMVKTIQSFRPHELYHTAAQSHVHTSFEQPIATFEADTVGVLNILEAIKILGYSTRMFNCSTSEMFGKTPPPQGFDAPFEPNSPYAIAKLASHHLVRLYRESYGLYSCSGITFNHEYPGRRGPNFVTRKISMGVAKCLQDPNFRLKLGNIYAKRDWGLASEFVKGFWMALQQEKPNDYIFSTGKTHSVEEFLEIAFSYVGLNWQEYIEINRFFRRPAEVDVLSGDYSRTKELIGWEPKTTFEELVKMMVDEDCRLLGLINNNETAKKLKEKE